MPRKKQNKKKLMVREGWAIYLRTSSKETQNPKNSQDRQRNAIRERLVQPSGLTVYNEYADTETGTSPNRTNYRRMLEDARQGKFSHIAAENAERFGRSDTEALRAIDEMDELGIQIRFADYPDLDPTNADDRIMIALSFTLARRESQKIGERARGGIHTKLRAGGHTGKAPDGYINMKEDIVGAEKNVQGRTRHWVEIDPVQSKVWVVAWELLLEDKLTYREICEELHARGYKLRSGRPFVTATKKGRRSHATNVLSQVFSNWFYAGWVVSKPAGIEPKTVRGTWDALVTTEDFERGLTIIEKRRKNPAPKRKHPYLLRKVVYIEIEGELLRLSGSTPNINRSTRGNPYYCLPGSDVNLPCHIIDEQAKRYLFSLTIAPEHIEPLRQLFKEDIDRLMLNPSEQLDGLNKALERIKQEELRTLRLYQAQKITDEIWDKMWSEWTERRTAIQNQISNLQVTKKSVQDGLEYAMEVVAKISTLYDTLGADEQEHLVNLFVDKVIVNEKGRIVSVILNDPFAYLIQKRDELKKNE